jgi:hypothetical protein
MVEPTNTRTRIIAARLLLGALQRGGLVAHSVSLVRLMMTDRSEVDSVPTSLQGWRLKTTHGDHT